MTTEFLKLTESNAQTAHPGEARRATFAASHLEVRMFNVGGGEAILITFPNRHAWLVDGGCGSGDTKNQTLGQQLAAHLRANSLTLEALVPSHPHKDHVGAVASLLRAGPPLADPLTVYRSDDPTWDADTAWIKDLNQELANLPSPPILVALKDAHREAGCPPRKPLQRRSIPFASAKPAAKRRIDLERVPVLISDHRREDDPEPPLTLFPVGANGSPATRARKAA